MFAFMNTKHLVLRNFCIYGHQMFGVKKCLQFWTPNIRCREMFAFLDTKRSVSRNVWISGHQTFGVEKCFHFWTPNVWCREIFAFPDTKCLVSRNICMYLSVTRNVYIGINCMQKLHAIFRIWEKKWFGKKNIKWKALYVISIYNKIYLFLV